ncbi:hypothetical protein TRICI_002134 [Trichomonascus ciferrii]|uniref:Protein BOI2 n=1 Tax=Trichomonascus ciferrii TaxID=44093 RepID=A0A642V7H6_9ASCO|nr:hypothetical protein TRICI_002134 [Trichomonascus ciferrii]
MGDNDTGDVEYLLGIHDFRARSEDEISLLKGDHIKVLETDKEFGDGWYIGENLTTGQAGLFPKVFTTTLILPNKESSADDFYMQHNQAGSVHDTLTDIDEAISEINNGNGHFDGQHQLNYDNIPEWNPYEVHQYFKSRGYDDEVCSQFIHHKITGSILLELELAYLKEIDITSFGTRFEISKDIKYLNSLVQKRNNNASPLMPAPSIKRQSQRFSIRNSSLRTSVSESQQQPSELNGFSPRNNTFSNHQPTGSFDKNWKPPPPLNHSYSADSTPPPQYSQTIPEHPSTDPTTMATNTTSPRYSQHRKTFSAGSRTSYVEDSRFRLMGQHSRQSSFDTVKAAAEERIFPSTTDSPNSKRASFLRRRSHSQSAGSTLDVEKTHKRRSSMLSALLGTGGNGSTPPSPQQNRPSSPLKNEFTEVSSPESGNNNEEGDDDDYEDYESSSTNNMTDSPPVNQLPQSEGVLATQNHSKKTSAPEDVELPKQKSSSFGRMKTLRQASSQHNLRKPLKKQNTTAFVEGIKSVSPEDSKKTATYSGWMHKKGGIGPGAWKSRFFTLHGTRLSYFTSMAETKERGLIDITSHRVLPARENEDKLVSFYAASVGAGRHCFKLVPPAPGTRKGVTFTAPKVHFFAVETKEEMRQWMAALMKATIDRDETKPVLTSCVTPTVPLPKAQELFSESRADQINNIYESSSTPQSSAGTVNNNTNSNLNRPTNNNHNNNSSNNNNNQENNIINDTTLSDSPGSSLRSSKTGSSATNSSSLKAVSSTTSPNDYNIVSDQTRHLTTKTAGLKIVTNLEESG